MGEGVSHTFHHPIQTTKSVLQFGLIACIAYAGISGGLSHYNNQKVAGNYVALSQQSPAIESQNSNNAFGKDVSVDNVGVSEQISKLSSAMEVSQSKALEAFTSTTVPQLFAMAKDPERKDIVTSVKIASWKQLGAQIETGPAGYDSSAKRGTAKQIESVMKVMYLNLALKMNSGNVDDLEQQKIVYTLDSLE